MAYKKAHKPGRTLKRREKKEAQRARRKAKRIAITLDFIKTLEAGGNIDDAVRIKMMDMKAKIQAEIENLLTRYKVFKHYGFDPGDGFLMDYDFNWFDIDGIVQLLRLDMLPLAMKSINAELDWLDGKLGLAWDKKAKGYRLKPLVKFLEKHQKENKGD